MKHHYPVRALSLLCALAIFMSLLPATLAADTEDDAALTAALNAAVVPNAVSPSGIQLNLFDYWVSSEAAADTNTPYSTVNATGINKDHYLKFNNNGPMSTGANNINQWTGSSTPLSGIVKDRLSGGYPVLTSGNAYGTDQTTDTTTEQSLAYLFDQFQQIDAAAEGGTPTGTIGKKTYWDVDGLLQIDQDGYYYYNASSNNVSTSNDTIGAGKYQSANYAYFDKQTNAFTLYNNWAVTSNGNSGIQGQFFPFTDPKAVFTLNNGALTQSSTQSNNPSVSHYFGMTMTTRFVQRYGGMTTKGGNKPMTFQFSGDDDVWIFIDGILVADLGGIHNQATTTIDFSNGKITINGNEAGTLKEKMSKYYSDEEYRNFWRGDTLSDDTYHTLKLFFLERGGYDSNLAMKFNLAHVPETEGIKVDQFGSRLSGVTFDLYAAMENDTNSSLSERYIIDESKGSQKEGERGLLASGITNSNGRFVLAEGETSAAISLNELKNQGINYLILRESGSRKGYRRESNIYLKLTQHGTDILLLNDEDHHWTTGTYAMPKETVYSGPSIKLCDSAGVVTGTADLSRGGTLFAVIMHRLDGVGETQPNNSNRWGVVTGNPLSGWTVNGVTNGGSYLESVLNAAKQHPDNCFVFKLASNGSYMTELNNCPGDIRSYYFWLRDHGGNTIDTAYAITYYYTTAETIAGATVDNTHWVDDTDFERQFAATIYIPNVKHYLNVQKLDDNNDPVNGVTFALYKQDDLLVTDTTWSVIESATPYDTVTTGTDGKATFPSEGQVLAEGKYYLVEDRAPVGYKVNATAVPILVDDEHGVMADAGTEDDGVAVTVAEGHLVPTMTPFATVDDIDRTLTNITTTRMEAESGWDPTLEEAAPTQTVELKLDTESFKKDHPVQTLRYIPVNEENKSLSWRAETGWLWFRIEQTPIVDSDPDKNLKTDLGNRDLTRLFTGETTVTVTDQRVGSLAVTKNVVVVDDTSSDRPDPDAVYRVTVTLSQDGRPINDAVACEDSAHELQGVRFDNGEAVLSLNAGQTITFPDLPVGTSWTVKETETLSSDLWRTAVTVNGQSSPLTASGTIDRADRDAVVITNRYAHYDKYAAAVTEQFKVRKIYTTGGKHSVYPGRVSFVLKDANGSAIQTISIDGEARAEFDILRFNTTGTYTYTVEEVNGLVDGMYYDPTVYTVDITVTENDAEHRLDAAVTWRGENVYDAEKGLTFTNTYTEPDPEDAVVEDALNVRKQYAAGSSDPAHVTTLFQIEAVTENAPMPNETRIHILGAHRASFGSLVFDAEGTYIYRVSEVDPQQSGLQIDPTVYTVTFVVTKADGKLTAAVSYAIGETEYLYSEAGNVLTFTNAFENKAEELKHASLSLTKEIGEGIDPGTTFDFLIEVNGASGSYDATQNGTASSVTFTDGKATVQLKGGETLLIKGLPDAALYTIQETTTGYTVAKAGDTGTLSGGQTATAHFTNTKSGSGENPKPNPEPAPEPGDGGNGGTPALNRRDHYAYIIGYPDGDVHPQGNITRAEVATIFFRLLRDPVRTQYWSQTNGYSDVPGNKWYNNAISTLSNMGIICGYPDGTFRPDAPITRAELTKIAAGFFSDPRVAATYDGRFSDVHGAEWYISYLMTALEEGLIEGYPDGSFRPNRPITRAETCTIVNRTLGRKPEKDHLLPESNMINWPDNINRNIWYYAQMQEATNSHDYRWISIGSEACEQWTAKLIERDWAALERTWSHANSAPGGEVMQ